MGRSGTEALARGRAPSLPSSSPTLHSTTAGTDILGLEDGKEGGPGLPGQDPCPARAGLSPSRPYVVVPSGLAGIFRTGKSSLRRETELYAGSRHPGGRGRLMTLHRHLWFFTQTVNRAP